MHYSSAFQVSSPNFKAGSAGLFSCRTAAAQKGRLVLIRQLSWPAPGERGSLMTRALAFGSIPSVPMRRHTEITQFVPRQSDGNRYKRSTGGVEGMTVVAPSWLRRHMSFPPLHRRKLHSTNPLERLNGETSGAQRRSVSSLERMPSPASWALSCWNRMTSGRSSAHAT